LESGIDDFWKTERLAVGQRPGPDRNKMLWDKLSEIGKTTKFRY